MDINVNLKVTIEETPGLLTTLNTLVECLRAPLNVANVDTDAASEERQPAVSQNPVPNAQPVQAVPAAVPTASAQYTIEDIQAACGPLMDAGKMNELAAILQGFGARSLLDLPAGQYGALAVKLRELGARL